MFCAVTIKLPWTNNLLGTYKRAEKAWDGPKEVQQAGLSSRIRDHLRLSSVVIWRYSRISTQSSTFDY